MIVNSLCLGQITLFSLSFYYSHGKKGNIYGTKDCSLNCIELETLDLTDDERIHEVIIYEDYRKIDNFYRANKTTYMVVGISLKTSGNQERLYGATSETKQVFSNDAAFLGYTQGKAGGFIDSLRLIFYKYCQKNSPSFTCTN